MYAIVNIAGQQFKIEKNNKVFVHRLENEVGSQVSFDKVLLIDNDGKVSVGTPVVDGASVVAKVVTHLKGDKVLVFKKKRRKGYQVLNGHRQSFTEVIIEEILEKGQKSKAKAAIPKPEEKAEIVEKSVEIEKPVEEKKATTKEADEKPAVKKAAAKKPATKKAQAGDSAKPETKKAAPKKAKDDKEESGSKE